MDGRRICDERDRDVRTDDEARNEVPEHDGLPEPARDDAGDGGDAEHDSE